MVIVEGGTFVMGEGQQGRSGEERQAHKVTLSTYSIGQTEVTQELWNAVMGSNPSNWKGSSLPVEQVSWRDCQVFIRKLNELTGQEFRLPTEAEWEFAARGGRFSRGFAYSGALIPSKIAWSEENSGGQTHSVASKLPNELGVYDMSGNVCEWCQDWYDAYDASEQIDPQGPASGVCRVFRGGSWASPSYRCRVDERFHFSPSFRCSSYIGLRLAL